MQAAKLVDGLRTDPTVVLTGLTAKVGALTVTNLHDYEEVCVPFQNRPTPPSVGLRHPIAAGGPTQQCVTVLLVMPSLDLSATDLICTWRHSMELFASMHV